MFFPSHHHDHNCYYHHDHYNCHHLDHYHHQHHHHGIIIMVITTSQSTRSVCGEWGATTGRTLLMSAGGQLIIIIIIIMWAGGPEQINISISTSIHFWIKNWLIYFRDIILFLFVVYPLCNTILSYYFYFYFYYILLYYIIFCRLQGQTDQEAHVPRIQVGKIGNFDYCFKPSYTKCSHKKILLLAL